jgi:hypothetical protein
MMSGSGRGRGRAPLKLAHTLRGEGTLMTRRCEVAVVYGIDVFREGPRSTASGWIEGACAPLRRTTKARLRLADGVEIEIGLDRQDAQGALVEIFNPLTLHAA